MRYIKSFRTVLDIVRLHHVWIVLLISVVAMLFTCILITFSFENLTCFDLIVAKIISRISRH